MDYGFAQFRQGKASGDATQADLLGGKGANLAEMANLGLPIPPGFTIPTTVCKEYSAMQSQDLVTDGWVNALMHEVHATDAWLCSHMGYSPLVSVRSGAPVSMPGMMDTILNVGLTDDSMQFWVDKLGKRAAFDSYRRLIQMMGSTAYGVPMEVFDNELAKAKKQAGVTQDADLTAVDLDGLVEAYLSAFEQVTGQDFPDTREEQLQAAVFAVFKSWMNPRAIEYRRIHNIDASMGTAVTIQAMVFGNTGDDSGTGVLFSRDAATGENVILGEFLPNAQGEDVVAGIRTPLAFSHMVLAPEPHAAVWFKVHDELQVIAHKLEQHYKDMVDLEFTVQNGKLYMLQCRKGKRSAIAAFRMATDMVDEGLITQDEALARLTPEQYKIVRRPMIDPNFKIKQNATGKGACPGIVTGYAVFTAEQAVASKEPCILITQETNPDDIKGMHAAMGILTATGGSTSHAAVVARAMDKPCVVGCSAITVTDVGATITSQSGGTWSLHNNTIVSIDGSTGNVWLNQTVPTVDASDDPAIRKVILACFDKQGIPLLSPGPKCIQGLTQPVAIDLSEIWGNDAKLKAILASIRKQKLADKHILLVKTPAENMIEDDTAYMMMATESPPLFTFDPEWFDNMLDVLDLSGLEGLRLLGDVDLATVASHGIKIVGSYVETVADILDAGTVTMEAALKVFGTEKAMHKVMQAFSPGSIFSIMALPEPADYVVFRTLGA